MKIQKVVFNFLKLHTKKLVHHNGKIWDLLMVIYINLSIFIIYKINTGVISSRFNINNINLYYIFVKPFLRTIFLII